MLHEGVLENRLQDRCHWCRSHKLYQPFRCRAYDPYRPGMESVEGGLTGETSAGTAEQDDLYPLMQTYRIDSETSLRDAMLGASVPDLPTIGHGPFQQHSGRRQGLTREELDQLAQIRRREVADEMERRKRGEIVIRLADIKVRTNIEKAFQFESIVGCLCLSVVTWRHNKWSQNDKI